MPHYFVPPQHITPAEFFIEGDEAHHLIQVVRCRPGTSIELFDGCGNVYTGMVTAISDGVVRGKITGRAQAVRPPLQVCLYQAVPKGDRFDWLIEKAAELGVAEIVPLVTARSVVRDISAAKLARWLRLSQAASKQCGRGDVMTIGQETGFAAAVPLAIAAGPALIAWESESTAGIDDVVPPGCSGRIAIFVGPEGGFTPAEVVLARNSKIVPVTLGSSILRVETAGLLSAILVLQRAGVFSRPSAVSETR